MSTLLSFGTKVFKEDVLEYGFRLLEYFRPVGISQESKRENGIRFGTKWYQEPF